MKVLSIAIILCLGVQNLIAQQQGVFQPGQYRDGVFEIENIPKKRVIPYTHLRQADVFWKKRLWRELDLREKQNHSFYFPIEIQVSRISLLQLLTKYILTGEIYSFKEEEFLMPYTVDEVRKKLIKVDTVNKEIILEDGSTKEERVATVDSTSIYRNFRKVRLKEDWFFDKQKSTLETRIIGMGIYTYNEEKDAPIEQFWVYYDACRPYLAKHEVFNTKNDTEGRSFDEVFIKRMFSSVIIKESNDYDRNIAEYKKGIDALLEAERIKLEVFNNEHDYWHF